MHPTSLILWPGVYISFYISFIATFGHAGEIFKIIGVLKMLRLWLRVAHAVLEPRSGMLNLSSRAAGKNVPCA
jgi:hypothetical protein